MSDRPLPDIDDEKLQRLRDRTDEIELIISGLTTVALFTLPGWLTVAEPVTRETGDTIHKSDMKN